MSAVPRASAAPRLGLLELLEPGIVLWAMVWVNIGSGHWWLWDPRGVGGYLQAVRAVLPFVAAFGAGLVLSQRRERAAFAWAGPVRLMAVYGAVALGSSVFSVAPFAALYWGGLYVSVFIVLEALVGGRESLRQSTQLLVLTWVIVAAYAVALAVIARHVMFGRGGKTFSGHGVIGVIPDVWGFGMSRSTGIARFAAVPAIVAFARLCHGEGARRSLWAIPFCGFAAVTLAMQARGALLGLAAALVFVLLLQRGKVGLLLVVGVLALAALGNAVPQEAAAEYISKGRDAEAMRTLTGRTEVWKQGWELFLGAPVLGLGPLADRLHLDWAHIHNTWLSALMQAGIVGTVFFVVAWVAAWRLFFVNARKIAWLAAAQRLLLIEAGAVLAFFTVRSIPEITSAGFSVDLLIMVPILAYLEVLDRSLRLAGGTRWTHWRTVGIT